MQLSESMQLKKGSVVQLNDKTHNTHFAWALMIVTEPRGFGAVGFVDCLDNGKAYYRASWEEMNYIGEAKIISDNLEGA